MCAIVIDTVRYKDHASDRYVETKAIKTKTGESLEPGYYDWEV